MLEALFEVYFRVLKHTAAVGMTASSSSAPGTDRDALPGDGIAWQRARLLKKCPLLYPAMEGLAK